MVVDKPLLRALRGQTNTTPPIWLMRQAGRYLPEYRAVRARAGGFLDLCYTPELAAEVTLQPIRRFSFDAAILFADIMMVPDGLGRRVWFEAGEGPRLDPVRAAEDVRSLAADSEMLERLAPIGGTLGILRDELPPETALIGFAGAPWTVATYMIAGRGKDEQAAAKRMMRSDPGTFAALISRLTEATAAYLIAQIDAGAEVAMLFDSWSGALADDPAAFDRCCLSPARDIIRRIKTARPQSLCIAFPRGAGAFYERYARESGADGLGLDETVDPRWARDRLQGVVALQGNLDPALMVTGGAKLERAARDLVETLNHGPYIFNLGHGITPDASPEHVDVLLRTVRG